MATVIEPEHRGRGVATEDRFIESPSPALRRRKRVGPKGFSWRRHWPIVAVVVAMGIVWLLPVIVAHTSIIDRVIQSAASELHGTVHVKSASLGWLSPVVLRGVEVRGEDGQPLLEVPEARGDASLLTMLLSKSRLGHFRVNEPKLTLVLREGGSNLEDAIAEYMKSTSPSTMDVAVEITDGTILVEDSQTRRSWQLDKLQLTWTDPLDPAKPAQGKLSAAVTEQSAAGERSAPSERPARGERPTAAEHAAATRPAAARPGQIEAALTLRGQADEATLKTDALPLAMIESLARRFVPGLRIDGRLTSTLEAHWDSTNPDAKATIGGRLLGEEVQLRLPALGKDQPKLAKLQASGQVAIEKGLAQCDRVSLDTDVGSLSLNGRLDLRGSAGGTLAATLAQSWDAAGQLDLARLAALLPNTLHIHKSAQITSGQVQLKLSSRRGQDGMTWQGSLGASNIEAVRDGRTLRWQQPILLTLAAHDTRQGAVIDSLKCQSDFVLASASGTRDGLSGEASFDLRKLADQASGFVDLGGLGVTGDGWAKFAWKRASQGAFQGNVEVQIDRFQWTLPDQQPWTEDRLHATLAATGRTDFDTEYRVDTAAASLQTGQDQWDIALAQPVADFHRGRTWTLSVHSTGQLAQWQQRLAAWLADRQWTLAGQYEFRSEVALSPAAIGVRQAALSVDGLVLENPSWKVHEDRVEAAATGSWDSAKRQIAIDSASLKSSTVAAAANKLLACFPTQGPPQLSGTITCDAALDRLHAWARLNLADAIDWNVSGTLSSRVDFQQSGGPIFAQFQAVLGNLAISNAAGQRYQEQEVRLTGRGSYNSVSRSLAIDQAQLTSSTLAGSASGRVAAAGQKTEMQIAGKVDYDLDRVAELLRSRYGDGIRLTGRGSSAITLGGPCSLAEATATAGVNWAGAEVYGFQIGPGQLQASLARGAVQTQPLVLAVNEGQVRLTPRLQLAPGPAVLSLAPGRVADQVRLTPATCGYAIQYLAPLLAGAVSADGRFSIDLEDCQVPLANPAAADITGRLTIHSAQVSPGPLLGELASVLGRQATAQVARESVVPFRMTQGRVYHKELTLALADLQIRTSGSVGLDQTLNMIAEVPLPVQLPVGGSAAGQAPTIQLPITGTLRQPRIDRSALAQAAGQTIQNAARGVLQDQIDKQLPGLLRPAPKR